MGNQISCDIGAIFIEITIRLKELPKSYEKVKCYYSKQENASYYFLTYKKFKVQDFKQHDLYNKLEKTSAPIAVFGVTYDEYFGSLEANFEHSFIKANSSNETVASLNYFWTQGKDCLYTYEFLNDVPSDGSISIKENDYLKKSVTCDDLYPYLLVNVKSGVSIYKVLAHDLVEKIGGSCLGLSTIWALFDNDEAEDLESLLEDLATGNSNMVDMTVGDIYGCGYLNLPQNLTASSCGKLKDSNSYARKDLAKSLLFMLLFNLGQISALHCLDLGMQRVAIVGSVFLNEHISRLMKFAFNYSSRGSIQLILCEYSQYLRSMGVNVGNNN